MLTDGLVLTSGATFPNSPADGQNFRLTAVSGTNQPGQYWYDAASTAWVTGDITSVVAGTGLTGGGTRGDVTLSIDPAFIAANMPATVVPYDLGSAILGKPAASAVVLRFVAVRSFKIPANFAGSLAKSAVAATASTVLTLVKNGSTIGTITFAANNTVGVFSNTTAITFAAGDVLTVTAPASQDATFADCEYTIAATL